MLTLPNFTKAAILFGLAWTSCQAGAALQGRTMTGNAVSVTDQTAVFLYDIDYDITWLRNANPSRILMNWFDATAFANSFAVGAFGDWRLPSSLNRDGTGPCSGRNCINSELGHLWHTELGKTTVPPFSGVAPFLNWSAFYTWSGTEVSLNSSAAWLFTEYADVQQTGGKGLNLYRAMLVRNGEVLAVPEPASSWTFALGLFSLLAFANKRRSQRVV